MFTLSYTMSVNKAHNGNNNVIIYMKFIYFVNIKVDCCSRYPLSLIFYNTFHIILVDLGLYAICFNDITHLG